MTDTTPYWMATAAMPRFSRLQSDLKVDVAVIGGGITGITAAYLLKKAGVTVALLDRDGFAAADSGHTTAHVTYVTDLRIKELVRNFGRDHARATWDAGLAAMTQIHETIEAEKIAAEFAWVPGYLHAPAGRTKPEEVESLQEDARLARELGFEATYLDEVPFMGKPGVRFANQAKFHPRKYLKHLLGLIDGGGSHVLQNSEVEEWQEQPLRVKANGHEVKCGYVVIATHVPLQGLTGTLGAALFQTKLSPYSTYAIGAKIPSGSVPEASFWDTADPYYYLRVDRRRGGDYAILGGADHKTGQGGDEQKHFDQVEKRLLKLIPKAEVQHRWSGQVIETADGLPFIGETAPKQFVATGFSGNGMTLGTLAGMMACDAVQGRKNPWQDLFSVDRKTVRGGVWDYLKENKDYPFYFLKDRLFGPGAGSLKSIKRGEGRIMQLESGKVAAYRDEQGKLTVKSAVCTHMGCLVRWNASEATWDCPCHGSRFQATGEVIGGPAETPLADAEAG